MPVNNELYWLTFIGKYDWKMQRKIWFSKWNNIWNYYTYVINYAYLAIKFYPNTLNTFLHGILIAYLAFFTITSISFNVFFSSILFCLSPRFISFRLLQLIHLSNYSFIIYKLLWIPRASALNSKIFQTFFCPKRSR